MSNQNFKRHQSGDAAGGGASPYDTSSRAGQLQEMIALSRGHNQPDLLDAAMAEDWDLARFRKALVERITTRDDVPMTRSVAGGSGGTDLADAILKSDGFKRYVSAKGKRAGAFEIQTGWMPGQRATLLTSTGVTNYVRPVPEVVLVDQQPATVAGLLPQIAVSGPTVRITSEASFGNAATTVAEEGLKPEASFDLAETDVSVKKIAVIGRVSDEIFADFPAVRDYITGRLRFMVENLLDTQLITGDGTGQNLTGLLNQSNIVTVANGSYPSVFDSIGQAAGSVWKNGFHAADTIVLHPTDWWNLRLSKNVHGDYLLGNPDRSNAIELRNGVAVGRCWGLPVVVTTSITQGTGLVMSAGNLGFLAVREGVRIDMSNSDGSDFVYNRTALRCEMRVALVVTRPRCVCKITGIA